MDSRRKLSTDSPVSEDELHFSEREKNDIFHALKVIGSVKEKQRLSTESSTSAAISVEENSQLQCLWRYLGGENRHKNIEAIQNVLAKAFALIEQLFDEREGFSPRVSESKDGDEPNSQASSPRSHSASGNVAECATMSRREHNRRMRNGQEIDQARREIANAKKGLDGLRSTYRKDVWISKQLELMIENIDAQLKRMESSWNLLHNRQAKT